MAATTSSSAVLFVQPQQHNCRRSRAPRSLSFPVARRTPHWGFHVAATSAEAASSVTSGGDKKPIVELEFIDPVAGKDGEFGKRRAEAVSGEKLLRNVMIESKIELYGPYGKVMNCGGGGSCGTCIVEIIDGQGLLNERTNTEERYLKKKPESWRLACQTIIGNKENSGKVVVQRLPQRKKK